MNKKTWGGDSEFFFFFYRKLPKCSAFKSIEILAYRSIGVITVNLQHNLPNLSVCMCVFVCGYVCVSVRGRRSPCSFDKYDSCRVAPRRQSVAAIFCFTTSGRILFHF